MLTFKGLVSAKVTVILLNKELKNLIIREQIYDCAHLHCIIILGRNNVLQPYQTVIAYPNGLEHLSPSGIHYLGCGRSVSSCSAVISLSNQTLPGAHAG